MFWDAIAQEYDPNLDNSQQRKLLLDHLRGALEGLEIGSVTDVGSGTGAVVKELFDKKTRITAIEPSLQMMSLLKNNLRGYNYEPIYAFAEIAEYAYSDLLLFSLSINWLSDPTLVLTRSLVPGPKYVLIARQKVSHRSNLGAGSAHRAQIQSAYKVVDEKQILFKAHYTLLRERKERMPRLDGSLSADTLITRLYSKQVS